MKTVLTAVAAVMLSVGGYAQTVTKSEKGAMIDCSALKSDGFTKVHKARTTFGTNDNSIPIKENATDIASKVSNDKIYYKFEVHGTPNSTSMAAGWRGAIDLCAGLYGGLEWRLPTQRELMLIYVLHPELKEVTDFEPFSDNFYWSATQISRDNKRSWFVYFETGATINFSKTSYGHRVRCVREIP